MNFKARAKKLLRAVSDLAFDQSGDAGSPADLVARSLEAVYQRGYANGRKDAYDEVFKEPNQ